jgi:GT2 family glycosyltransferase
MLVETVTSILQGNSVPSELVIIDQSDVSNTHLARLTTERDCELRYLWTQTAGLSCANNLGITTARHDLLVFTHDDVLVTPTWLDLLLHSLVHAGPRAIITGRVLPLPTKEEGHFAPSTKIDPLPEIYEGRIARDVLFPMSMAMYRSAIDCIGGFDERLGPGTSFPAAEDNDLGFRFLEAGFRIIYDPDAVLYHRPWRTEKEYLPLRWGYGRGQGAYYAKHLSLRDRYMISRMCLDIARYLFPSPRRAWRNPRRAIGSVVYAIAILSGAIQWLTTERQDANLHKA